MRRSFAAGVALAALWAGMAAAQSRPVHVQLPAQPMESALEQLAKQSGVDILFTQDAVKGLRAPSLTGDFDAQTALRRLLQGTPLVVTQDPAGALIVRRRRPNEAPDPISNTGGDPVRVDDIVVTGIANSLAKALDQKRLATNVVDVVKAEDIGKFPAQNIAEALQRVPGVSIVRDRGEGVFVRVRGLGPSFDIVTLNGRTAAVNENVRDGGTTGRQFRFDTFASELVSAVEVIKSPKASLDEGGIAGIVNMRTFRPLDFSRPTVSLSATGSYAQLANKKVDPPRVRPGRLAQRLWNPGGAGGDKWNVAADLTYSRAYSNTPEPITRSRLLGPVGLVTFDYALAGSRLPTLGFSANLNDPGLLPGRRIEYRTNDSIDFEQAAKLDVGRGFGETGITALRVGAKIQSRSRDYDRRD